MEVEIAAALRAAVGAVADDEAFSSERFAAAPNTFGTVVVERMGLPGQRDEWITFLSGKLRTEGLVVVDDAFDLDDDIPDTPQSFCPVPLCASTERLMLAVVGLNALLSKSTVSYGSENDGELFVNLVAFSGEGQQAEKSKKPMRGHTDAMSFPFPGEIDPLNAAIAPSPDLVCLAGLRNPDETPTTVMPLDAILEKMDEGDIRTLMREVFVLLCQETFKKGTSAALNNEGHFRRSAAILRESSDGGPWVRFSHRRAAADDDDQEASEVLGRFTNQIAKNCRDVVVRPGAIALINNRKALHGRRDVGENVGGDSRWLVRSYAMTESIASDFMIANGKGHILFP